MEPVNHQRIERSALALIGLFMLPAGLQAAFAPQSFFEDFPLGRSWISHHGDQYNEHLVRDVGALGLGITILLVAAAWTLSRPLLLDEGAAMTAAALPHTLYHLRHADVYDGTADKVASLGGVVLYTVLGGYVLVAARVVRRWPER